MTAESGFTILRAAVDQLTADLGGSHLMRLIVAKSAAEILRRHTEVTYADHEERGGMFLSYLFFATEQAFVNAAAHLKDVFSLSGLPAAAWQTDEFHGGHLVLRDNILRYETTMAGIRLVSASKEERGERWRVFLLDDGETLARRFGKRPSVATTYAKSQEGVTKSMKRLAEDAFGVQLSPLTAAA